MTALIVSIESARYVITPTQIEQLAGCVVTGEAARGVYLQTLIAATQDLLGKRSRATKAAVLAALESVYKPSYEAVQRGVAKAAGGPISATTLARRSGFARTAASALRKWVEAGGDIRTLKPGEVSRRQLRPEGPSAPAGTTRAERAVLASVARIVRAAERTAKKNGPAARSLLESALEVLGARLDAMADGNAAARPERRATGEPRVVRARLQRVQPETRSGAAQ
jgi:hypothetical protein